MGLSYVLHRRILVGACDAHECFPEIAAFEHPDEGRRRVLEPVGDVLAITDAAIGDCGRDGAQEVGIMLRGEFVVDETAQREALAQHLAHGRGEKVRSSSLAGGAILRDQPAYGHAREGIEQGQHRLPNGAADIFEIDVDAFRADRGKLFRKVPPAIPTALAPAILASCPTSEPTGPLAAATTTVSPCFGLPMRLSPA